MSSSAVEEDNNNNNNNNTNVNPDLVTMEDDNQRAAQPPSPNQQQGPILSQNMNIAINFIAIGIFLGITLSSAEFKEQYLSALALLTPVLAILKLARDKGGFDKIPFCSMMLRFTIGFVLLLPLIIVLCLLWSVLINFIFSVTIDHFHKESKWDLQMINFIIALVLSEETAKLVIYLTRDKRDEMEKPEYYIYFGLSTALGLTCAEIYFATFFVSQVLHAGEKKELQMSEVVSLVFIFTGFLVPMQLIGSYYVGLASAKVQMLEKNPWKEFPIPISLTVIMRTCFLLSMFLIAPSNFGAGIGLAFACYFLLMWIVLRYQNTMPVEYLRATGHLNLFGYGTLPSSEDESNSNNNNNNGDGGGENGNNHNGEAPGSTMFNDEDENEVVYIDGETPQDRERRLTRIRQEELRMKELREENEKHHIEVVIPSVVTPGAASSSFGQAALPSSSSASEQHHHEGSSVRTMFDTNTTNTRHEDEADQGEELQDKF